MRTPEGSIASKMGFANSWRLNCLGLSARIHLARATGGSVDFASCTLQFKDKIKTVGVARQQLHFLCSDKENEAKKAWRCAGHIWLVKAATSIRNVLVEKSPTLPPQVTRLLRASTSVAGRNGHHCF